MTKANTGKPGKYATFVQSAIDIAQAEVDDPFKDIKKIADIDVTGGSYAWRQVDSADPGGKFIPIPKDKGGIIARNKFYALKK
jgi:hypothetical protein